MFLNMEMNLLECLQLSHRKVGFIWLCCPFLPWPGLQRRRKTWTSGSEGPQSQGATGAVPVIPCPWNLLQERLRWLVCRGDPYSSWGNEMLWRNIGGPESVQLIEDRPAWSCMFLRHIYRILATKITPQNEHKSLQLVGALQLNLHASLQGVSGGFLWFPRIWPLPRKEKLQSPLVVIGLFFLSLPFIAGTYFLAPCLKRFTDFEQSRQLDGLSVAFQKLLKPTIDHEMLFSYPWNSPKHHKKAFRCAQNWS